jgi:hypothetical protein
VVRAHPGELVFLFVGFSCGIFIHTVCAFALACRYDRIKQVFSVMLCVPSFLYTEDSFAP